MHALASKPSNPYFRATHGYEKSFILTFRIECKDNLSALAPREILFRAQQRSREILWPPRDS